MQTDRQGERKTGKEGERGCGAKIDSEIKNEELEKEIE